MSLIDCVNCGRSNPDDYRVCPTCGFPLMLLAGKYRLVRELAEGGMGKVYLAEHVHLDYDTERVIKVIKSDALKHYGTLKRFRREVQVTAALSQQNQHIVRIFDDFGEEKGLGHYYVMEYLQGITLQALLSQNKKLNLATALSIFAQFCEGMAAAHHKRIVHRDLKPENLLLIERGANQHFVKIIDFGIARPGHDGDMSQLTQGIIGTPMYMSPEQCVSGDITPQADIYSMGLILYEMLSGTNPYGFLSNSLPFDILASHMQGEPKPLSMHDSSFACLDPVLDKALQKPSKDRFASVEQFWNKIVEVVPSSLQLRPLIEPGQQSAPVGDLESAGDASKRKVQATPTGALVVDGLAKDSQSDIDPFAKTVLPTNFESVAPPKTSPVPKSAPVVETTEEFSADYSSSNSTLLRVGFLVVFLVAGAFVFQMFASKPGKSPANNNMLQVGASKQNPKQVAQARPVKRRGSLSKRPTNRADLPAGMQRTQPPVRKDDDEGDDDDDDEPDVRKVAPPRRKRRVYRRRARRRTRRSRARKRKVRQRKAAAKTGPCGSIVAGVTWVKGRLLQPRGMKPNIRFSGCSKCRVVRKAGLFCLGIPTSVAKVRVRVSVAGFFTCVHWINSSKSLVTWKLKRDSPDALSDPSYQCAR